jgi:hypothetical protein
MQTEFVSRIFANLREARNNGKFLVGSTLALCNQPTEEVLSPKLKKHSSLPDLSYKMACQIVIIDAMNSKQLFFVPIAS